MGGLPLVEGDVRGRESGIGTTCPACRVWVWLPPGVTERFFLSRVIPGLEEPFVFRFVVRRQDFLLGVSCERRVVVRHDIGLAS